MNRVAVVLVLGVLGCADKAPQDQCEDLVGTICDRATECLQGAVTRDRCVAQVVDTVGCERARVASSSYDSCVSRVESQSCPALFPDPTSMLITAVVPAECHN